jgi:NAD(P)-dependent dehydrogenase (short-subunit alcohol dehydrogenase family)
MSIETDAITPKKNAIVTGGSRGIGRNTVESLARREVNSIFTYHTHGTDAEAVVVAVKHAGAEAVALQLDAGNIASFDAFVESVKDALSKLGVTRFDFLVDNAGNSHRNMPFETTTEEELDSICNVHFKGVFFLTQKLLPFINDGGRIINVSTARTRTTGPGGSVYASMKGAVEALSKHMAKELGPRRIAVNVVVPGATETDFSGGIVRDNPAVNKGWLKGQHWGEQVFRTTSVG